MFISNLIIYLLATNAIAHVISFAQLRKAKSPDATGVFIFILINAILAILLWSGFAWAIWGVVVFAFIGGAGLLTTTIIPKKGKGIDYVILILDILIICLSLSILINR